MLPSIGDVINVVSFVIDTIEKIKHYNNINDDFRNKLVKLSEAATRFKSYSLTYLHIRETHSLDKHLVKDTEQSVIRAKAALDDAKT